MSGRFRLTGTSWTSFTDISIPDSALAIVVSPTRGFSGHVARIRVFISRSVMVGRSSTSIAQKSLISASILGGRPPPCSPAAALPVVWNRRTIEYAVLRRNPRRSFSCGDVIEAVSKGPHDPLAVVGGNATIRTARHLDFGQTGTDFKLT